MTFTASTAAIGRVGSVDHIAFVACVQHGNHNNEPLIDSALRQALQKLAIVHSDLFQAIAKLTDIVNQP